MPFHNSFWMLSKCLLSLVTFPLWQKLGQTQPSVLQPPYPARYVQCWTVILRKKEKRSKIFIAIISATIVKSTYKWITCLSTHSIFAKFVIANKVFFFFYISIICCTTLKQLEKFNFWICPLNLIECCCSEQRRSGSLFQWCGHVPAYDLNWS